MYRKTEKILLVLLLALSMIGCGAKKQEEATVEVEESKEEISLTEEELTETIVVDMGEAEDVVIEMGVAELTEEEAKFFDDTEDPQSSTTEEQPKSDANVEESTDDSKKDPKEDSKAEAQETMCCEFKKYRNMNATDQKAFAATFEDMDAFFAWYDQAEVEHEKHDTAIEVGGGAIDMEEILGGDSKGE